jgi:hypothetical protein
MTTFKQAHKGRRSLADSAISIGKPFKLFLPPDPPASVSIVSIDGNSVITASGNADAAAPLIARTRGPVQLVLAGQSITPGTVVEIHVFSADGSDQVVSSSPLQGTFESSTAMASINICPGVNHAFVKATWKNGERSFTIP